MKMKNKILEKVALLLIVITGILWIFVAIKQPEPFNYLISILWTSIVILWIYSFWKKRRKNETNKK